jgi:anti-anti-sigma factor
MGGTGRCVAIAVAGELTRGTSCAMVQLVRDQLGAGCRTIRIRMDEVSYVDARGLAALIVTAKMAAECGASLVFDRPSRLARRLLELGGLSGMCRPPELSRRPA